MFRSIFCMTGLVICFMVGLSLAFSVIMDMNMAKNFKQGIKLNGEIVQVFLSRDKRVAYIGPKVSVILYNQERIFQSVIMYQSYKINDQVEVFYNEKKYPKYVYIYNRKKNFIYFMTMIILILCHLFFSIAAIHTIASEKFGVINSCNELIAFFILLFFSIYPAYKLAKKINKIEHFNFDVVYGTNDISASNMITNRYLDIMSKLRSNLLKGTNDIKVIQEAEEALNAIRNNNRYLEVYLKLTIEILDSYISLKDYVSALKLIESIKIFNVVRSRDGLYNWQEVVQLLDRKIKILKEVGEDSRIEELILEEKPLMKRAEKYFQDNNPGTIIDVEIKRFYYECCLFEGDFEGAKEQANAMCDIAYYKQADLNLADLLLAEISKIQGDMQEYTMRMEKAENIARIDSEKSENRVWFKEYKIKLEWDGSTVE